MAAIRTVDGQILLRDGAIAISDDCCCRCEMHAVIFVDFACPCGYGAADDEYARVAFDLRTKDGTSIIYDQWPSYIRSANGTNSIRFNGGVFDVDGGGSPPSGYQPGENRVTYDGVCGREIFDENSLVLTSQSPTFDGYDFEKEYDSATKTWTYHFRIKNDALRQGQETIQVRRKLIVEVTRGPCCWSGGAGDASDYETMELSIYGTSRQYTADSYSIDGETLTLVYDTGAFVEVCGPYQQPVSADNFRPGGNDGCEKHENGDVYYHAHLECSYGREVTGVVRFEVPGSGECACLDYFNGKFSDGYQLPTGVKLWFSCPQGTGWREWNTSTIPRSANVSSFCCCDSEQPCAGTFVFKNSRGEPVAGPEDLSVSVDGATTTFTPLVPVNIEVSALYPEAATGSNVPATKNSCNGMPDTLLATVSNGTGQDTNILLALDGSVYKGKGYIKCTTSSPQITIYCDDVWLFYPTINSMTCGLNGWNATGSATPKKRLITVVQQFDASAVRNAECRNPMYQIGGQSTVDLTRISASAAFLNDGDSDRQQNVCSEFPYSCDMTELGSAFSFMVDRTSQPGIYVDENASGSGKSVTWNSQTGTLTISWAASCDPLIGIMKVPVPTGCYVPTSGSNNWISGSYWVLVGETSTPAGNAPTLCDCLQVLDWVPYFPAGTITHSVGYGTTTVEVSVEDATGYWAIAQSNGITDFSCYGEVDGQMIQFSFDGRFWYWHGTLTILSNAPTWYFSGPMYGHGMGEYVPTATGSLTCDTQQGILRGIGSV